MGTNIQDELELERTSFLPDKIAAGLVVAYYVVNLLIQLFPFLNLQQYGGTFPGLTMFSLLLLFGAIFGLGFNVFLGVGIFRGCRWAFPISALLAGERLMELIYRHLQPVVGFPIPYVAALFYLTMFLYTSLRLFGTLGPKSEDFLGFGPKVSRAGGLDDEDRQPSSPKE